MQSESGDAPGAPSGAGGDEFWSMSSVAAPPGGEVPAASVAAGGAGGAGAGTPRRSPKVWIGVAVAVAAVAAVGGFAFARGGGSTVKTTNAAAGNANGAVNGNRAGQGRRGGTAGTLQSVNGTTLTVATQQGQTIKVATSSSTVVTKAESGSLADIKVGDAVTATGAKDASGTLAAARITDQGDQSARGGQRFGGGGAPPNGQAPNGQAPNGQAPAGNGGRGFGANGNAAFGTVKSIAGSNLVVTSFDGTDVTVSTTPSTAFTVLHVVKLSDLAIGQQVVVRGATNSDGSIAATTVQQGGGFGGGFGRRGGAGGQDSGAPQGQGG